MSTLVCISCSERCEIIDPNESDLDVIQWVHCPHADAYCEWKEFSKECDEFDCSICGETTIGFGYNPGPYHGERCCGRCRGAVIRARSLTLQLGRQLSNRELKTILAWMGIEEMDE